MQLTWEIFTDRDNDLVIYKDTSINRYIETQFHGLNPIAKWLLPLQELKIE